MVIKNLVISGGGPAGLLTYGAAKYLSKNNYWSLKDIKTIYGCSIGAYIGIVLSLGYEWDWLDDYFIKRPWNKLMQSTSSDYLSIISEKGLLGDEFVKETIKPLLNAKNLNINITLKEFYEFNNIEIHLYTVDLNEKNLTKIDISYKTHPNLPLYVALAMTMSYPFLFKPVCRDNSCYIDGGLVNNYPLNDCIEQTECSIDEILAFKNVASYKNSIVSEESNIFNYFAVLLKKMHSAISTTEKQKIIPNTVQCLAENLDSMESWMTSLKNEENRRDLINKGWECGLLFKNYIESINNNMKRDVDKIHKHKYSKRHSI